MFGRYATTRSPGSTPYPRRPVAMPAAIRRSSPQLIESSSRSSEAWWIAAAESSFPWKMCSAYDSLAPGNHSAPGISREPSTRS